LAGGLPEPSATGLTECGPSQIPQSIRAVRRRAADGAGRPVIVSSLNLYTSFRACPQRQVVDTGRSASSQRRRAQRRECPGTRCVGRTVGSGRLGAEDGPTSRAESHVHRPSDRGCVDAQVSNVSDCAGEQVSTCI